jgi:uncharacterized RDD family membrane protein YckC
MEEEIRTEMEREIEKRVTEAVTTWTQIIIQVVIMFVIAVIVLKFVWAWVVPDLFPGAVDQGLISESLTWLASLKLAVLVGVLSGVHPSFTKVVEG